MRKILTQLVLFASLATTVKSQLPDFQLFNTTNTSAFTGNNFKTIAIGKDSFIWAGTQYQGLYRYNPLVFSWTKMPELPNVFINDIKADKNGGIWIAQSGTSGTIGGGSNIGGGISYFTDPFATASFYSATPGGGLTTRNVRSLWIDTTRVSVLATLPRIWAAQGTFITGGSTAAGGVSVGLNATTDYFTKVTNGLQVFPYVSLLAARTPNCISIGGNRDECWVGTLTNFSKSQIIRYHPLSNKGTLLGVYDHTNVSVLPVGFRPNAIFFDSENRQWIGLASGGMVVKEGSIWTSVNMPSVFPAGTTININAISEDADGNIYIGTSNGLVVYSGGSVDNSLSYELLTTQDGLPSNNITGVCADIKNGRILLASDNGVAFWNKQKKIDVQLVWDNSFPSPNAKAKGVVADGVSRLYLKIKRPNDTVPPYKDVEVSIKSFDGSKATFFGGLKRADTLQLLKYSNEANSGTVSKTNRIDSTVKGEYWFWYVAPTDFSLRETSIYSRTQERKDTVKVLVTYNNDTKDSVDFLIRVSRPPTVFVHGLASYPEAWDGFPHSPNVPFVTSNLFKYTHAMKMDGRAAFIQNAITLLGGDLSLAPALSSLQGNIAAMRDMGFAANQVDYVCHSMGGIMLRSAIRYRTDKYYADDATKYKFNNYGKGFVHKLITINTPHNGSPLGDAVHQFIPQAPIWVQEPLYQLYIRYPNEPLPFDFILPDNSSPTTKFDASPAVSNLAIATNSGGVKMVATPVKHHLIVGDVDLISSGTASTLAGLDKYLAFITNVLEAARTILPEPNKSTLTAFLRLAQAARGPAFMEWYSAQKGFPNFLGDGDLVVPLASQLARLPENIPSVTKFYNTANINAWHSAMLARVDVGDRVLDLLNTNLSSTAFADIIPANTDPEPAVVSRPAAISAVLNVGPTIYDTSKIVLDGPSAANTLYGDSLATISFRIKDTADLAYIKINFQNADSFVFKRDAVQALTIRVKPAFPSSQLLWAVAVYDKPTGTTAYIDTLQLSVANLATLQNFRVTPGVATLNVGVPYYPTFEVSYNDGWYGLPSNTSGIQVTIEQPTLLTYDVSLHRFTALGEGFSQVYLQYNGMRDTIDFNLALPAYYNCTNISIASGSFKNPAIWSKGVVPDICDSTIISTGHTITLDTSLTCRAIRINTGGTLVLNNSNTNLNIGQPDDGNYLFDNYGILSITNGNINIRGRMKFNSASTLNMSGGKISIDGNTGVKETAVENGLFLFEAAPAMQAFSFTAGSLEIVDPPFGNISNAISCPYNFGMNSILYFGNGISTTAGGSQDGFGGQQMPSTIGRLVIDAVIRAGNRQFVNKKPLTVRGGVEIKTGSGVVLQSQLNVTQ